MPLRYVQPAESAFRYQLLVKSILKNPLSSASRQEIVYRDRRLSYHDLNDRVAHLATMLEANEVTEGTTVAIMDWDTNRYLECYFAIPMMGAVMFTVNVRLAPEQIRYTLNHSKAEVLLLNRVFANVIEPMRSSLEHLKTIIWMDDTGNADMPSWCAGEYEALLGATDKAFAFKDFDENALATTFYTSGTTGDPKAVCFSHRQLVLLALSWATTVGCSATRTFGQDDVYMPITPMFHVHAWGFPYVATLLGVKQVYPGRYEPESILNLRKNEGVSFSHCVPTILMMLLEANTKMKTDLSGWSMIVGGSALTTELARQALDSGINVLNGYGMSETGAGTISTRLKTGMNIENREKELNIRCKSGLPNALVETRVVDEEMNDIPPDGNTAGEVVVRSPWVTPCYLGDEEASEELWRGGYLHTQDIANIDEEGYVQICDRLKDAIKSGGEWISSLLIEDLISRLAGISEVAVIGVEDEKWGERPLAMVVLSNEARGRIRESDIHDHLMQFVEADTIPRYAIPNRVLFVDELAKTSVGKIDKKVLRQRV